MTRGASPNAEAIAIWNEILVPKFTRFRKVFVEGSAPHSRTALARHPVRPGERVLDVGCGFGETSLELGRTVAPGGRVLGIDVCPPFLDVARGDAARAGMANVGFRVADAQVDPILGRSEQPFDVCFSRFGTMFFANPAAAFRNLRVAMRPGGRLLMIVWRRIEDNDWAFVPKQIARKHLPPPPDAAPTCGPGPFSMADAATVQGLLAAAGWHDPGFERIDGEFVVGGTLEDAIAFQLTLGPAGEVIRDAGPLADEKRPAIVADLREALAPFLGEWGAAMHGSSWCVTARA